MAATEELSGILTRRQEINDKLQEGQEIKPKYKFVNCYTEFHEFSRKEIKQYEATFNKFDEGHDGFLDLNEVKRMMERLGAPQTHLGLKAMISEVDEDEDNKISFREFLLIYRKARAGELENHSGLEALARLTEINVEQVGVNGAKDFFEAKIEELAKSNKFHNEILQEQEQKRKEAEERALRKQKFNEKAALFRH